MHFFFSYLEFVLENRFVQSGYRRYSCVCMARVILVAVVL